MLFLGNTFERAATTALLALMELLFVLICAWGDAQKLPVSCSSLEPKEPAHHRD
jgi:hypothetical protein